MASIVLPAAEAARSSALVHREHAQRPLSQRACLGLISVLLSLWKGRGGRKIERLTCSCHYKLKDDDDYVVTHIKLSSVCKGVPCCQGVLKSVMKNGREPLVLFCAEPQAPPEREPEDFDQDPSTHPTAGPLFMQRSRSDVRNCKEKRRSQINLQEKAPLKKSNSCSTIYLDDSTVSQPNLRCTIKCVTLAIYYHIRDRGGQQRTIDIFDERLHPLSKEPPEMRDPDHRTIYRFVRTLFNAAQLSAECAIITLVYLERLLTYAEMDISPCSWRRVVLGAVLLASKFAACSSDDASTRTDGR
ncbi:hypothetical protein V5799_016586 [Amblyomma americanum]|uniref:Cyclin N-terminal domain-containing protein n=1 Tax=Amblyomma americanum TaxID=6943 RepID=A0AAQ4F4Q0_AMBAM